MSDSAQTGYVVSCMVGPVGCVLDECASIFYDNLNYGVVMNNKRTRSSVPRKAQDRRGRDFGSPAGCPESRIVAERRKRNVDFISGSDWMAYKALLGSYQRAIDKSFLD